MPSPVPIEVPDLIGVDGIARLFGVVPNTAYSWAGRGKQLGKPDARLSRRSMWYADRFPPDPDPTRLDLIDKGPRPPLAVILVGPAEVAEAFGVQLRTVEAWRGRARDLPDDDPLRPPTPRFLVSQTPFWAGVDWRPYATARRKAFDLPTLTEWRRAQKAAVLAAWSKPA